MCVCVLQANGHADRIESLKPLFVEPKGKSTFTAVSLLTDVWTTIVWKQKITFGFISKFLQVLVFFGGEEAGLCN